MDWSSIVIALVSAVIGGLLTGWSTNWAPRRELQAAGLDELDQLQGWNGSVLTDESRLALMDAHRAARATLIKAGVSPRLVEEFNAATLAYASWQQQEAIGLPGQLLEIEPDDEAIESEERGRQLLALACASHAVVRYSLLRPRRGRLLAVLFRQG